MSLLDMKSRRTDAARLFLRRRWLWLLAPLCLPAYAQTDLADLNIDQLMNLEITTASKKEQKLSETPAAVFVLTHDDIMRSGATTLPELLLTVPGVEGGTINSHSAAIGIRGLGGQWSDKLLVLIDGHSIYTRTFSGVYWDSYNIPFEDIERIEVIRGANAALWGSNAVNGVINIITRNSGVTQGTLLRGDVGTHGSGDAVARYGTKIGEGSFARAYVSGEKHGSSAGHPSGDGDDDWNGLRTGIRGDWDSSAGTRIMAQADAYRLRTDNNPLDWNNLPPNIIPVGGAASNSSSVHGVSALVNLTRAYALTSEWSTQLAYSHAQRDEFLPITEDTFDADFQHHFQPIEGHDLVWGLDTRYRRDDTHSTATLSFDPSHKHDTDSSAFFQDEIAFAQRKVLTTIGARLEHDETAQWDFQPSLRTLWNISESQKLWAALSRSSRTPSRVDHDLVANFPATFYLPPYGGTHAVLAIRGNSKFKPEEMTSYEVGYRLQPTNELSFDLALYWNHYDRIRIVDFQGFSTDANGTTIVYAPFDNGMKGEVYGGELVSSWALNYNLRLQAFWSEIRSDLTSPIILNTLRYADQVNNSSPKHQIGLRTDWDFANHWSLNTQLKYVSELNEPYNASLLKNEKVPSYIDCDINLFWQLSPQLQLALLAKNLLESSRLEYSSEAGANPTEVRRAAYIRATWNF